MRQSPSVGHGASNGRRPAREIGDLHLDGRAGQRTWLGHTADGARVAAVRLFPMAGASTDSASRVIDRATALASVRSPRVVPVVGVASTYDAVWLVSEWDEGLRLRRLLQVAGVTADQVRLIAADLVSAVRTLRAAGSDPPLRADDVRIDQEGGVRLTGWGPAALNGNGAVPLDHAAAPSLAVLFTDLARAVRRSWPGNKSQARSVDHLDEAAEQLRTPGVDLAAVEAALTSGISEQRALETRAELASLVTAVGGEGLPRPIGGPAPTRIPPVVRSARGGRIRATFRTGTRSLSRWVVALGILAIAAGVELFFLRGRISDDLHKLVGDRHPAQRSTAPAHPVVKPPRPVPALAPASAGAVSVVDLRTLQPCAPRSICSVRVLVRLRPHAHPVTVTWTYEVIDRCTGRMRPTPGGSVVVSPRAASADAVGRIRLPAGKALALVTVTSRPARVASPPVLLPAGGGSC